jgi:lipoprotein-anchoring transpeptidase ErfK/SrfK
MARRPRPVRSALVSLGAAVAAALAFAGAAPAALDAAELPKRFPAAGELLRARVAVRAAPDPEASVLRRLRQLRPDYHPQVVLALAARRGADGDWWYELSLPGRPNGQRGWVRADRVALWAPARSRIVVHRGARRLEVRRIADGAVLLRARVAVGKPGAETPLGRDFYVQSRFVPDDPFLGTFALETSAYSRLSDWPGGGVVGIHGTSLPELIGRAVSHGCVRVTNATANALRRLAPLGTPVDILP